ncbi:hypothetical protein N9C96_01555 [bacterium]|nr:hypothetical protein [bacterium]
MNDFATSHFVTRLIIISYFIAVALNIIPGAEVRRLAEPFMPAPYASYTMSAVVLTLCGMVLLGIWCRAAALVLALVVFWTSYISLYSGGELDAFWRDLALIGALLLASNVAARKDEAREDGWNEDEVAEINDVFGKNVREVSQSDGQFREDFDIVNVN